MHIEISHSTESVRDMVHPRGIEKYCSLLKRTIMGTYVSVATEHLQKYVKERTFRYNERKGNDHTKFFGVVKAISGKRLSYSQLIGLQTEGQLAIKTRKKKQEVIAVGGQSALQNLIQTHYILADWQRGTCVSRRPGA